MSSWREPDSHSDTKFLKLKLEDWHVPWKTAQVHVCLQLSSLILRGNFTIRIQDLVSGHRELCFSKCSKNKTKTQKWTSEWTFSLVFNLWIYFNLCAEISMLFWMSKERHNIKSNQKDKLILCQFYNLKAHDSIINLIHWLFKANMLWDTKRGHNRLHKVNRKTNLY